MPNILELQIDFEPILKEHAGQLDAIKKDLQGGVQALAASTHAHVLEKAAEKLHSRHDAFRKACSFDQISPGVWAITVAKEALWIEDGMTAHSLLPDLLSSDKAKTAKDGTKYIAIPFQHNKAPTRQTAQAKSITDMLKSELRARKIPYQKVERNADGSPKIGLVQSANFGGPQRGATKINAAWTSPALDGVRIYQQVVKNKKGGESVQRSIMTFRMASSKQMGAKWNHPGLAGVKLLDEALEWAAQQWEKEILPSLLQKYKVT